MAYSQQLLKEFPYAEQGKLSHRVMVHFNIALLFPIAGGVYFFGLAMVRTAVACVLFCMLTEWVLNKLMKKEENTLTDLTAVATGLIIAINMRPAAGIYALLLASIVSIAVGKIIFGGKGFNPINPAVIGRLIPVAGFPALWATAIRPTIPTLMDHAGLTYWEATQYVIARDETKLPFYDKVLEATPSFNYYSFSDTLNKHYDVLSSTTYLETVKSWYGSGMMPAGISTPTDFFDYWTLFIGNMPGTLGETSKLLLLLGFLYLVITRVISPLIPLVIWAMTFVFGWVFAATRLGPAGIGPLGLFQGDGLIWLLAGGMILGSVYMETDPVSSPRTTQGKLIFSFVFVAIVTAIRLVFSFPEGVSFALLASNLLIPFIDKFCDPEHKYASQIKKSLLGISGAILLILLIAFVKQVFFGMSAQEKQVRELLAGQNFATVQAVNDGDKSYYAVLDASGKEIAQVWTQHVEGYDFNNITVMVAVADGKVLTSKATDVSTQTEGLGQRVAEKEFENQFLDKSLSNLPTLKEDTWSGMDMVTEATYTSKAYLKAVRDSLENSSKIK